MSGATDANVGLVLTGGGARAAYHVGALLAIAEMRPGPMSPFRVLTGTSAGALNAASIAVGANDYGQAVRRLAEFWRGLTAERIYHTGALRLASIGSRWIRDLSAGGLIGKTNINYLLDTAPLTRTVAEILPISRLATHFRSGLLRGVAVSATSYAARIGVTFFDGARDVRPWFRTNRIGIRERLQLSHILAALATPVLFPPVEIKHHFYGGGGIQAPLSPAIHLGASRILAISLNSVPSVDLPPKRIRARDRFVPALSGVVGSLLNGGDALDLDFERLEHLNQAVRFIPPRHRGTASQALRNIPALVLRPSQDLGTLANAEHFPAVLRYLFKGVGVPDDTGSDVLSHLAFEPEYANRLIDLGYEDTMGRRTEIDSFFAADTSDRGRARKTQRKKDAPLIFISYAREDEKVAMKLHARLRNQGLTPWIDKEGIPVGTEWERVIRTTIAKSDFIVVCLSRRSLSKRGFFQREIRLALDCYNSMPLGQALLMPVRLEDCDVPEELARYQYADLFTEDGFGRLVRSILAHWAARAP